MNILIVDDEAGALRDLTRVVRKVVPNEEIYTARETGKALEICRNILFDVAFLDISMPDMDGLTLAKKLKAIHPLINIIIVTAYPDFALEALHLYICDYILKPADPEHVKRALEHLRHPVLKSNKGLFVQCFGNFEVFYDGVPVRFGRLKAKELFAYLIDRKGAAVTNAQLRSILWMDEANDSEKQRKYFARLTHDLQNLLESMGLSDIFVHHRNSYYIIPEKIPCDYYRALNNGDVNQMKDHEGYMDQYEWASWDY